ncbi:hypothetical protein OIU85_005124 [Salix viminalis]|uniref:Uncharacterized protein n=1 Tax=Salix viminalis TaxID=40686 RepID=A0A9Q0PU94_SALVM|nr:hypothetical protein OIU85_005124 [Salix viminalis]
MAGKGSPFFAYLALLFLVAYFGSSVFFFLSTISSIPEVGNALAGLLKTRDKGPHAVFNEGQCSHSQPTYWKWLMYVNPIHWANVSFCRFQFSEGYSDPSSNYLGQLPFFDQFPTKTVGKAYLAFYELSEDSKRSWLPYVILLGWIAFANILTLFGLKNIEFVERSQSLPYVRKSTTAYNYEEDAGSEFQSNYSFSENSEKYDASTYPSPRSSGTIYRKMKNNGKVDAWMEEFRVHIERNGLGIPVKPVTPLFEGLSFTM